MVAGRPGLGLECLEPYGFISLVKFLIHILCLSYRSSDVHNSPLDRTNASSRLTEPSRGS